jgi:signal transduction histidine kinase
MQASIRPGKWTLVRWKAVNTPLPNQQAQTHAELDTLLRARLLFSLTVIAGFVGLVFGVLHGLSGSGPIVSTVHLLGALACAGILIQNHLGVRRSVCVYQFLSVITVTVGAASFVTGGISSPALAWMAVIPVFALALDRPWTAAVGSVMVVGMVVALGLLSATGLTWDLVLPTPLQEIMIGGAMIALTASLLTASVLSQRMRHRIHVDLHSTNLTLQDEVDGHNLTRDRLKKTHRELVHAAHIAGAAEVATGVLHNLGNALTAVNVSASLTEARVAGLRLDRVERLTEALPGPEHTTVRRYIDSVHADLERSRTEMRSELESLRTGVDHAIATVTAQQRHARGSGVLESIELQELLADALLLSTHRHGASTHVSIDCRRVPRLVLDRHRLVQIITNLVGNAHDAIRSIDGPGRINVVGRLNDNNMLELSVTDNGVGVAEEDLDRIFAHGFTTKADGHGFGLHACALSAKEVGGSLMVNSKGHGQGATFILRLPVEPARVSAQRKGHARA